MLVGVAALSAWGLYRFNQILATKPAPHADSLPAKIAAEATRYREAFADQYGEMFGITMIICIVGAFVGLLIAGRHTHAESPDVYSPRPWVPVADDE